MSDNAGAKSPKVRLDTSYGPITIELFEKEAPATVANFLSYVDSGHYQDTIFHRVIEGFMIQGGGMIESMEEKDTEPPIVNEAGNGVQNSRGSIAMARTQVVNSATAQFFINVNDNDFLNHRDETPRGFGYCVFGKVSDGMKVVDKINSVATCSRMGHDDVPQEPVVIKKAERV